jgi:hypothetical protein
VAVIRERNRIRERNLTLEAIRTMGQPELRVVSSDLIAKLFPHISLWPDAVEVWTYVLLSENPPAVKIGRSTQAAVRMERLQTGHPGLLSLIGLIPGDYEQALHDRFDFCRIVQNGKRTEWFRLHDRLAAWVNTCARMIRRAQLLGGRHCAACRATLLAGTWSDGAGVDVMFPAFLEAWDYPGLCDFDERVRGLLRTTHGRGVRSLGECARRLCRK